MKPIGPVSPILVPVARFSDKNQAAAFCEIATECGVATRVSDSRRFTAGFDATMGGADKLEGCSVLVKAGDVPVLRAYLEASLEIDPMDPLHTAGRSELRAMEEGPLDGNLCEQIIASKILATLPPEAPVDSPQAAADDAHLAADRRFARWLGGAGLLFTAIYLSVITNSLVFTGYLQYAYPVYAGSGLNQTVHFYDDGIARNIRPLLLMIFPMGTGAALILSRRQLRDGSSRRMFPPFWRITGYLLFWIPVLVMSGLIGLMVIHPRQPAFQ